MSPDLQEPLFAWFLVGPTAVGKSAVAQWLAEQMGAAILSADSMQVYRGMDRGTAKPAPDTRGSVVYYGLDLVAPDQPYNAGAFRDEALRVIRYLSENRKPCIVTGGSGLYVKSLTHGLARGVVIDPAIRAHWQSIFDASGTEGLREALRERAPQILDSMPDPGNPRRLMGALERLDCPEAGSRETGWTPGTVSPLMVGLDMPSDQLKERIRRRAEQMYRDGLIDECAHLIREYPAFSGTAGGAIGYAEAMACLRGELSQAEAIEQTVRRTWQLARRQRTWFRHQARVDWIAVGGDAPVETIGREVMARWRQQGPTPLWKEGA
ncbi:MAG: tRNA (adenosine(37)-N6)-dimethylallyltransferase MiaA [Lentisphaerae bacterium RIFOXYC12_FULL_60_16]|nr:MAG: tRNA (adenosine(37)-N6)-dimethylallyltransferase MiaA [Lentisphaerae bacterium RIFOXYC12_FULL_60_16]